MIIESRASLLPQKPFTFALLKPTSRGVRTILPESSCMGGNILFDRSKGQGKRERKKKAPLKPPKELQRPTTTSTNIGHRKERQNSAKTCELRNISGESSGMNLLAATEGRKQADPATHHAQTPLWCTPLIEMSFPFPFSPDGYVDLDDCYSWKSQSEPGFHHCQER